MAIIRGDSSKYYVSVNSSPNGIYHTKYNTNGNPISFQLDSIISGASAPLASLTFESLTSKQMQSGIAGNAVVSSGNLMFNDALDVTGSTSNPLLYTSSVGTMTITASSGHTNFIGTTTANDYYIQTSNRYFAKNPRVQLVLRMRMEAYWATNNTAFGELGFGIPSTYTAIINDGSFIRVNYNTSNIYAVSSYNGTETQTLLGTYVRSDYYSIEIIITDYYTRFIVWQSNGTVFADITQSLSVTQSSNWSVTRLPVFQRLYNGASALSTNQLNYTFFAVYEETVQRAKKWTQQLQGIEKSLVYNPISSNSAIPYSNSAAPTAATVNTQLATNAATTSGNVLTFSSTSGVATGYLAVGTNIPANSTVSSIVTNVSVTLSNNVTGGGVSNGQTITFIRNYDVSPGMGGLYVIGMPTGAEYDYGITQRTVQPPYQFVITGIRIFNYIRGVTNPGPATVTTLEWFIAVQSDVANLWNNDTYPPIYIPLGIQTAPASATLGTEVGPAIDHNFQTPIICDASKSLIVGVRVISGAVVTSFGFRGGIFIEGYAE